MVKWDRERLMWEVGDTVIKRFQFADEKDLRNRLELKNIAELTERTLYVDYFGYSFKISFEEGEEKHLDIEVSSPRKGLEEIAGYINREVRTGLVFSEGFLKSIGERSSFEQYEKGLEYIGMQETESEYAPNVHTPLLRISYRINDNLIKSNLAFFKEAVLSYAILPFFVFALNNREN